MAKLSAAARYTLTSLVTAMALTAVAYWILRPAEWRPHLLGLLSRSFIAFTRSLGTNRHGWMVSDVYSSVFVIVVTVAITGRLRGMAAMREHWIKTSAIALLALVSKIVLFSGAMYLRQVTEVVYVDHQSLVLMNARQERDEKNLSEDVNRWKTRALTAEKNRTKPAAISQIESSKKLGESHTLASDALDFQDDKLRNAPGLFLIAVPGGPELMRKNIEDSIRYNQQAVVDFLKRFGGPIESILRRARPYGLDTSRLQRHVGDLNSIQMMRLIAGDLNDLADQLDRGNLLTSNR